MFPSDDDPWRSCRRDFLSYTSLAVASACLGRGTAAGGSPTETLPTIALGPHRVTRLIAGANPISGYSYLGSEMDQQMKDYFNHQRTLDFLKHCEVEGINTHQFSIASKAMDVYRALRQQGSQLHLIGLHSDPAEIAGLVESVQPIGLVHHGGVTDRLFREGRSSQVHDYVKAVHDHGLLAGVSAHNPNCIQQIADQDWEVDFFMTCFYYITRSTPPDQEPPLLEGPDVGYRFYQTDPQVMCRVIRQVKQPCLGFKILAAGRRCASQETVRAAFQFALDNIKPTDAVIVGMYPRDFDQIHANVDYAHQLSPLS